MAPTPVPISSAAVTPSTSAVFSLAWMISRLSGSITSKRAVWLNCAGQVDGFARAFREPDVLVLRDDQRPERPSSLHQPGQASWRANTAKVDEAPATTASPSPPCASKRRNAFRTAGHW